jgi:hypothetical protein
MDMDNNKGIWVTPHPGAISAIKELLGWLEVANIENNYALTFNFRAYTRSIVERTFQCNKRRLKPRHHRPRLQDREHVRYEICLDIP